MEASGAEESPEPVSLRPAHSMMETRTSGKPSEASWGAYVCEVFLCCPATPTRVEKEKKLRGVGRGGGVRGGRKDHWLLLSEWGGGENG